MLLEELVLVSHISSLGDNALFFEKGHDTKGLLDQLDSSLEIHTEIDEGPFNTFSFVFFLFKDEHVVIEELLESLVGVVDAKLFESVKFENFETGDIEDTNEVVSGKIGGEGSVDDLDQPLEESVERGLDDSTNGVVDLLDGLTLDDVLSTDFDLGSADSLKPFLSIDTQEVGNLLGGFSSVGLGLFFSGLLLELSVSRVHKRGSDLVDTSLFFLRETKNVEGLVSGIKFLAIVNRFDLDLSKRAPLVIVRVGRDHTHLVDLGLVTSEHLVENMEATFGLELEGNSRLFQKVSVDITGGELASDLEVNTDEFTESRRVIVTDGLGVTKSLHSWVSSDDLIFEGSATLERWSFLGLFSFVFIASKGANDGKVLDDSLGVDSLTGSRFTSNQHRLVLAGSEHVLVGVIGNRVDVGRHLSSALVVVAEDDVVVVHGKPLVRVNGDTEKTRVGVDKEELVSRVKIVHDGGFRQVGQVGHILQEFVLWRVLGLNILGFEQLDFVVGQALDFDLAVFLAQLQTLAVAGLGVGNPNGGFTLKRGISDIDQLKVRQSQVVCGIAGCFGIPKRHD